MAQLAADLPDPAIWLAPDLERALYLLLEHDPHPVGQVVARAGVQVDRFEYRPPHVVLDVVVSAVADADRARALVAV